MSKSYKKTPIAKCGSSLYRRFAKRQANKRVRKILDLPNGQRYRKYFPQDEIYDFIFYESLEGYLESFRNPNSYMTRRYQSEEEVIIAWKILYYYK